MSGKMLNGAIINNWYVEEVATGKYALVNNKTGKVVKRLLGYFDGAEIYPNGQMFVHTIDRKGYDTAIRVDSDGNLTNEEYGCVVGHGKHYNPQTAIKRYYKNGKFVFAGVSISAGSYLLSPDSAEKIKDGSKYSYYDENYYNAYKLTDGSIVMINNYDDVADFRALRCFQRENGTVVELVNGDVGFFNGFGKEGKLYNVLYDDIVELAPKNSKKENTEPLFLKEKNKNYYRLYSHRLYKLLNGQYTSKYEYIPYNYVDMLFNGKEKSFSSKCILAQTTTGYNLIDSEGDEIYIENSPKKITSVSRIENLQPMGKTPVLLTFEDGSKKFLNQENNKLSDSIFVLRKIPAEKDIYGRVTKESSYQPATVGYGIRLALNTNLEYEYEVDVKPQTKNSKAKTKTIWVNKNNLSPWLKRVLEEPKTNMLTEKEILSINTKYFATEQQREFHRYVLECVLAEQRTLLKNKFNKREKFQRNESHVDLTKILPKDKKTVNLGNGVIIEATSYKNGVIRYSSKNAKNGENYSTFDEYALYMRDALRHAIADAIINDIN